MCEARACSLRVPAFPAGAPSAGSLNEVAPTMMRPTPWTGEQVSKIVESADSCSKRIAAADVVPVAQNVVVWDAWPVQHASGHPFSVEPGHELWMALAAPRQENPDERHNQARIHLLLREEGAWRDLGPAMPDDFSPGSREWSGCAVIDTHESMVTLYFTASGRRGEQELSFEQRIFSAQATLEGDLPRPRLVDWRNLREAFVRDPAHYMSTLGGTGEIGKIKAFRDPAFFRDPTDGNDYLFFAGSQAGSDSDYNGVVGAAIADRNASTGWRLLPPIVTADGLNNELERPHVVRHKDLYYLFWSTQGHVFNPAGPTGPTGLYGMVSKTVLGGWEPLNGSGLVFANPAEAPAQTFSWLVLPDLSVTSFIDDWKGVSAPSFGGTFAPFLHLELDADRSTVRP